jgi:hypothetical protein
MKVFKDLILPKISALFAAQFSGRTLVIVALVSFVLGAVIL